MNKTKAQNKYFEALNAMQNIYQNDDQIDSLLDNMFAEFDHNTINLDYGNSFALLVIIGKRFNTVKKGKVHKLYPSDHQLKFEKLILLHDEELKLKSFKDLGKYGTEILPSGLESFKQQPKNLQEIPENLIHFDNTAEKYLLLNELGIIDFLNKRYPLTSQTKQGLLLAYITDTKNGKPFENILSAVYNKNTKSDYYPFKEKNETKVNRILADIGIEKKTTIAAIKKK